MATGLDFSTGDYGETSDTDIWYTSFITKYETRRLIFKLTVPYLRITGPGAVVGDTVVSSDGNQRTETGVGDVIAGTFLNLSSGAGKAPLIDLGVKVKFGTADEDRGLGSGEEDYSLQLDLADNIGKFTIFGTLGYKWRGEPEEFELEDGAFASLGGGYKFRRKTNGGLILDVKEPGSSGQENIVELTAYIGWKLRGNLKLLGYAVTGFSDTSPDGAIGLQFSYRP